MKPPPGASYKSFRRGTHRTASPVETLARMRQLFGPLAITRVANVTGLDCIGIPVVMVCRPNSRSLSVSQGKGLDLDAARVSGVMESIELYHAERITHPLKLATWNELRFSHDLVAVDRLPRIATSDLHPDSALLWIEGVDLLGGRRKWLPYELVHTNYTLPLPTGSGLFVLSSNGLASGNHPSEAVCHALCEVIERDAAALHHFRSDQQASALRVDLATVDDPDCRSVLELYERAGVAAAVWDMTSDLGVATFRCVILDRQPSAFRPLGPVEGMGTHPTREVALLRALTEAAQARLTLIAGSRDDNGRARYARTHGSELIARAGARLLEPGTRPFAATPTHDAETFEAELVFLLGKLSAAGVSEVMAVDLTKPELGVPVVRVVVPGLEPYHHIDGYIPGPRARAVVDARVGRAP